MVFCRAAWQRLAPLTRKTLTPLSSLAVGSVRLMSFGLPASGTNIVYMALCGGSLTAALLYAYKTININSAVHNECAAEIESNTKRAVADVAAVLAAAAAEPSVLVEVTLAEPILEAEDKAGAESETGGVEVEADTSIVQAVEAEEATQPATLVVMEVVPTEAHIAEEASVEEAAV